MATMTEVKIQKKNVVIADRLRAPGDLIEVEVAEARALIADGSASWATRVRSIREGVMMGERCAARGDVVEVEPSVADRLVEGGWAEHYTDAKAKTQPPPIPTKAAAPKVDPFDGQPPIRIEILGEAVNVGGGRSCCQGDEVSVAESRAIDLAHLGLAKILKPESISERGKYYAGQLRRQADATY